MIGELMDQFETISDSSDDEQLPVTKDMLQNFLAQPPEDDSLYEESVQVFQQFQGVCEPIQVQNIQIEGLRKFGNITGVCGDCVIIQTCDQSGNCVDSDTILFRHDGRVFGRVVDVFGPVQAPLYIVQFDENSQKLYLEESEEERKGVFFSENHLRIVPESEIDTVAEDEALDPCSSDEENNTTEQSSKSNRAQKPRRRRPKDRRGRFNRSNGGRGQVPATMPAYGPPSNVYPAPFMPPSGYQSYPQIPAPAHHGQSFMMSMPPQIPQMPPQYHMQAPAYHHDPRNMHFENHSGFHHGRPDMRAYPRPPAIHDPRTRSTTMYNPVTGRWDQYTNSAQVFYSGSRPSHPYPGPYPPQYNQKDFNGNQHL